MDKKWKKIESKMWKPENDGDSIEGVLINKEPKTEEIGAKYTVQNKEGTFLVWGSAVLDDKMQQVGVGSEIRITFEGKKSLGKGKTLNQYEVEVAEKVTDAPVDVEDIPDAE